MSRIRHLAGVACAAGVLASCLGALEARPAWAQGEVAASEAGAIPVNRSFRLHGAVAAPRTYTLRDLRAAPITTEAVYFNTGTGAVSAVFKGVLLWTLLQEAGIRTKPAVKNDILRRTIAMTGTDGYRVVLSAGEINPAFGGELAIIACAQDGRLLGEGRRLRAPDRAGGQGRRPQRLEHRRDRGALSARGRCHARLRSSGTSAAAAVPPPPRRRHRDGRGGAKCV